MSGTMHSGSTPPATKTAAQPKLAMSGTLIRPPSTAPHMKTTFPFSFRAISSHAAEQYRRKNRAEAAGRQLVGNVRAVRKKLHLRILP
jgi:hypothetical protein